MSITNFTPGPWAISALDDRTVGRPLPQHPQEPRIPGFAGVATAIPRGHQETVANARLISAAPDLYAALDAFLDAFEETGEVDYAIRQKARAALNRAEGRTP